MATSHPNGTLSKSPLKPTSILHRTPWQPPVAVSAQGIYITLEDGTHLIDAVGGAAVTCIGNSHPKVMQAIKDQVDKVSCTRFNSVMHILFLIAQP
jgi:4-aminobutyrate aminotransferase-like enzyme